METINQEVMDETTSRIEFGCLPEKVRVAIQFTTQFIDESVEESAISRNS